MPNRSTPKIHHNNMCNKNTHHQLVDLMNYNIYKYDRSAPHRTSVVVSCEMRKSTRNSRWRRGAPCICICAMFATTQHTANHLSRSAKFKLSRHHAVRRVFQCKSHFFFGRLLKYFELKCYNAQRI